MHINYLYLYSTYTSYESQEIYNINNNKHEVNLRIRFEIMSSSY